MQKPLTIFSIALAATLPQGCATTAPQNTPAQIVSGDAMVHCLLPPQVRKVGNLVYPSRRQLVYETSTKCSLRGGEYTVYDRATAQSSADFYLELANQGDAEAQYSLAMVYESLFNPAQHNEAAKWYQLAAAQSHSDAQKNLAFLYEQGLGVAVDKVKAVNLLRQAGGINEGLVLASELNAAKSAAEAEIRRLSNTLESQNAQTVSLQKQLSDAANQISTHKQELNGSRQKIAALATQMQSLASTSNPGTTTGPDAAAQAEEVRRLELQMASNKRMVSEQELIIASLEADLSAQQAQLSSSEKKAQLQEQRLAERLAETQLAVQQTDQLKSELQQKEQQVAALTGQLDSMQGILASERTEQQKLLSALEQNQSDARDNEAKDTIRALMGELSKRDEMIEAKALEIATLQTQANAAQAGSSSEVASLQGRLADLGTQLLAQQASYQNLQKQLEIQQAASNQTQSEDTQRLMAELGERGEIIAQQAERVQQLESQAQRTAMAIGELQTDNDRQVSELDYLHAKLVSAETTLVQKQTTIAGLQQSLAQQEQDKASLLAEKSQLNSRLSDASNTAASAATLSRELAARNRAIQTRDKTIAQLNSQIAESQTELASVQEERNRTLAMRSAGPKPRFPTTPNMDLPAGNRYALLIGNDEYSNLASLTTAAHGAKAVSDILESTYGYKTTLLTNASKRDITDAFARLQRELDDNDYVLIYYAGHGDINPQDEAVSYWLPVDARADKMFLDGDGIKSQWITEQLAAMQARHVMVIADSCYAGAMVRPPRVSSPRMTLDRRRLEYMLGRRSRTVLSSGENKPVLDESFDGQHSVFTQALVEVLEKNPGIIHGEALHAALVDLVRFNARQLNFTQVPLFSEIAAARHGNGQFVLKATRG